MKNNLQTVELAFPKNMMSSSRSEFNMPSNFAKVIKNMIIHYSGAGSKRNGFSKIENDLPIGEKIIKLKHFPSSNGEVKFIAFTQSGKIFVRTENSVWQEIYSKLTPFNDISTTMFANKLIIANGVDNMLSFDGEKVETITQYISQSKFSFSIASNTSLKTDVFKENFPADRKVKVKFTDGEEVETTVSHTSASLESGFIILHFNDEVITKEVADVSYQLIAPAFARVYSAHDRLWAMGKEKFDLNKYSSDVDRARIYYTDKTNDEASWFDDEGNLSGINIADKMPESEELVAMAVKDNMTIFFCRNYSQVWAGTNPRATGDFTWVKTLPIGLTHPELVVNMPNDIGFFSQFGARTFSRFLQTEQLDIADMGSEVATDIHNAIEKLRLSIKQNKNIHSFQFHQQNWFGFKLEDETMIFQTAAGNLAWSKFDGIFADATAFLNTPNGKLYAAVNNKLYEYDIHSFADDSQPIHTVWTTAWFEPNKTRAWANKYTEIILEPSALKTANLQRYKNYNSASYSLKEVNLKSLPDYFDTAHWDNASFDANSKERAMVRDKFIANNLSFSLQTNDTAGPLTVYSVRFYGSKEK
tara:strand:- start:8163 stop:9923 length:1761 start_codon:yes stop_codon:yes gene_type:complete